MRAVAMSGEWRLELEGKQPAQLRFRESADAIVLDLVVVPRAHRGQGLGTLLVERLLGLADGLGKPVELLARPIGGQSPEALARLVAFYERLGFVAVVEGVSSVAMRREVGGARRERPR